MNSAKILLLGESDVGKTHFGAQLLLRLRGKSSALTFREHPTNIAAFEHAISNLNKGKAAIHTGSNVYVESNWPLHHEGFDFDLVWPDYAGEQLTQITTRRLVTPDWRDRVLDSTGWALMLRLKKLAVPLDSTSKPLGSVAPSTAEKALQRLSDQARIIELLQILLFTKQLGTLSYTLVPKLTLLLSCWDELDAVEGRPDQVLAKRLPLVHSFVTSVWRPEALSVFGLSALGRSLNDHQADSDYIDRGPAAFGYVVTPLGQQSGDLTLPILNLAG